jgi:hypothetical protein
MYHQTREGEQILIKDMTTQHILNTIKLLEGNISRKYLAELLIRTKQYATITKLLEDIRDDDYEYDDYEYDEDHFGMMSYSETFFK